MNVMKKAHELTRNAMAQVDKSVCVITYKQAFSVYLREAHQMNKEQMAAVKHFEDCIEKTLVHFEALNVNDYYIAIENNAQLKDYTILKHKVDGDTSSPLGWASYSTAIVTHRAQAVQYEIAYPGVCKLHAMTHLSNVIESFRDMLKNIQ